MLSLRQKNKLVSTLTTILKHETDGVISFELLPGYQPTVGSISQHLVTMIHASESHHHKTMTSKDVERLLQTIKPWVEQHLINMTQKGAEKAANELYLPLMTYLETHALWH